MPTSPFSQAIDARAVLIQDVLNSNTSQNRMLKSRYEEDVRQWVANKQQQKAGTQLPPIPVPPKSWVAVPHTYTRSETLYDASYPGIAPMIDDVQIGPPVAEQYVEPVAPQAPAPGTVVDVGPFLRTEHRGGKLVDVFRSWPDDNEPDGYVTTAPDGSGRLVKKQIMSEFGFGSASWYETSPRSA